MDICRVHQSNVKRKGSRSVKVLSQLLWLKIWLILNQAALHDFVLLDFVLKEYNLQQNCHLCSKCCSTTDKLSTVLWQSKRVCIVWFILSRATLLFTWLHIAPRSSASLNRSILVNYLVDFHLEKNINVVSAASLHVTTWAMYTWLWEKKN